VLDNHHTKLSPLEEKAPMKALFLGTLAASQAKPIIDFITADIGTEILDSNEPARAAALADADVLLTEAWRNGFPPAPKLRLLQVPLADVAMVDIRGLSGHQMAGKIAAALAHVPGSSQYVEDLPKGGRKNIRMVV
jgi:hypothetical protein